MSPSLAHVHQVRRLLSDHQTWPIAAALLSRTYHTCSSSIHMSISERWKVKKLREALISTGKERPSDRTAREAFTEALHDILKHKSMHGLVHRGDRYVSVRELLNYQHFRMLTFSSLQKVVNEDRWHRFELLYEPLKGREIDSWWIRVKDSNEKGVRLDPILISDHVKTAIYIATLQDWRSYISLKGISRLNDNHIQIFQGVPVQEIFTSKAPISEQILIQIDVEHAINMGIRFYLASRPSAFLTPPALLPLLETGEDVHSSATYSNSPASPSTKHRLIRILTPGNEFGFLPPECFRGVEVVNVKRKVLWTVEKEPSDGKKKRAKSPADVTKSMAFVAITERGYRTTEDVEVTEKKDLDQFFIDLPIDHEARVVHSDLKKEALAVLSA